MSLLECRVAALAVYPVKSCAGIELTQAQLTPTGLQWDRQWMVVDEQGVFLSQRELPRMALIHCALRTSMLELRAPGMLALHVPLAFDDSGPPLRAQVWADTVKAQDCGTVAAQWLTDFLGRPARLVRFDPRRQRDCDARWLAGLPAHTAFADGFPLLVTSTASLAELNRRLHARGVAAVAMARFRPNVVLDGLAAHDEDHVRGLRIGGTASGIELRLVKPCGRCSIPDVEPATARVGHAVSDELASYRSDPRVNGAATFGVNAVVVSGQGSMLTVDDLAQAELGF